MIDKLNLQYEDDLVFIHSIIDCSTLIRFLSRRFLYVCFVIILLLFQSLESFIRIGYFSLSLSLSINRSHLEDF